MGGLPAPPSAPVPRRLLKGPTQISQGQLKGVGVEESWGGGSGLPGAGGPEWGARCPLCCPGRPQIPWCSLSLISWDPHVGHPASDHHLLGSRPPLPLGPCPLPPPSPTSVPPQSPVRAASWHWLVRGTENQPRTVRPEAWLEGEGAPCPPERLSESTARRHNEGALRSGEAKGRGVNPFSPSPQ